ncbi:helix-turn-helix transcriptional regulator [Paenibacillus agricola]|uniref:Helix-turn-helix domain-containing protein n=1 Tax=Paenibacillus agricola TaxID=2716264 RepID=A0ABX0J8F3_9BACL|nr:helix-turn-helix domain-containing protein [Paenibacillus agricola]NHN32722.1 helix-turn-helix domain-containing protein [Paenibacillus agricola]
MIFSSKPNGDNVGKRLFILYVSITLLFYCAAMLYMVKNHYVAIEKKIDNHISDYKTMNSIVETLVQKIGSISYQIATDYDTNEWAQYNDNNNLDYYTLYKIQRRFISIINSDPEISSIYLYNRKTNKIFSTNFMISDLEAFPGKLVLTEYLQNKEKTAFSKSRVERQTDSGVNMIIPYVTTIPASGTEGGVLVVNINEKKLLTEIKNNSGGIILFDDKRNVLTYRNNEVLNVFENSKEEMLKNELTHNEILNTGYVKWNKQTYFFAVSNGKNKGVKIAYIVPYSEILSDIQYDNQTILYVALATIVLLILSIITFPYFKRMYSKPLVRYSQNLKDNIDDLRETLISHILTGKVSSREEIINKTSEFTIDLVDREYLIIVFQVNDYYKNLLNTQSEDRHTISRSILKAIKYMLMVDHIPFVVKTDLDKIAVLLTIASGKKPEKVILELKKTICYVQKEIQENFNLSVCAAVTEISNEIKQIPNLYAQAVKGLDYRVIYGRDSIIECKNFRLIEKDDYIYPLKEINHIADCIRKGNIDEIEKSLNKIFEHSIDNHLFSLDAMNAVYSNILYSIVKYLLELGYSINDVFQEDIFVMLYGYEMIQEKKAYILRACSQVLSYKKSMENNMDTIIMEKILLHINNHFDKNISLSNLAEEFHMNPSYLSSFIKKNLGFNFIDYVNDLRVEKSIICLKETELTVQEIAKVCGYDTVHSYIRNFKKNHDVTPAVFRTMYLKNKTTSAFR